jgi:hypothetical protein
MAQYMFLLYRTDAKAAEAAERSGEASLWAELNEALREAGLLVGSGRLHPVETATTARVREGEVDLTDGPFAVTKEVLAGYYLLECRDLDEALRQAVRFPLARYGSIEVRPLVEEAVASLDELDEGAASRA